MNFFRYDLNIDFIGRQRFFIGISVLFVCLSLFIIFFKGLQFGIDFSGGTEIYVKFKTAIDSAEVRNILEKANWKDAMVQHFGKEEEREFLIRLEQADQQNQFVSEELSKIFTAAKGKEFFEITKVEVVGPRVGSDLKRRGAWAMFYSLIGILLYVALRFDIRFSPGAVVALIHDVIITLGVFTLAGKKFDLTILAALLTIVGYSVNDTIVIFDRIRENMKSLEGLSIVQIVNRSINETLSRTIITSFTVFLVVIALFVWGGQVIHDFSFSLIFGLIAGTYSTIFIASPLFLFLHRYFESKKA
ncbi:MAG: protein translocase subunit SecF [Deltaproteobacteria bacterium]|nr:protein translocase subunit SecF [Deltaproteobacteria bacterium]